MRPPLRTVLAGSAPPTAKDLLREAVEWAEYAYEFLKDDQEGRALLPRSCPG
jgi:hypothetical protein